MYQRYMFVLFLGTLFGAGTIIFVVRGSTPTVNGVRPDEFQLDSQPPLSQPKQGCRPYALEGYCPVTLLDKSEWRLGDVRWSHQRDNQVFLFAGGREQQRFLDNPVRYTPLFSGNDIVLADKNGVDVPGLRRHGITYRGYALLFANEQTLQEFWENPQRYLDEESLPNVDSAATTGKRTNDGDLLLNTTGRAHGSAPDVSPETNTVDSTGGTVAQVAETPGFMRDIAGKYYRGDGTGFNLHLELMADGSYQCEWTGCLGVYGNCAGSWKQQDNRIEIKTTTADGMFEGNSVGDLEIQRHNGENVLIPLDDREFFDKWGPTRYSCFSKAE